MADRHPTACARARKLSVEVISLTSIDPPHANPRDDFDAEKLRSLSESIAAVGLLEPVIVRPVKDRYELVAGERRFRAVKLLGWKSIDASIRELTDRESAEVRLLENLDRESLNPLEEAAAFRQLADMGHTPASLAKLARLAQDAVENRLSLLELPADWQKRVRQGQLSAAAAEYLLPWRDCPKVMRGMAAVAKGWPMMLTDWRAKLAQEVIAVSRNMDADSVDGPVFEPNRTQLRELDVRPLRINARRVQQRAMNVQLWDELQDMAELHGSSVEPKPLRPVETAAAQRPVSLPLPQAARRSADAGDGPDRGSRVSLKSRLQAWHTAWLRRLITSAVEKMPASELLATARQLDIDPEAAWKLERSFLELLDSRGLRRLADELNVDISSAENTAEMMAVLLHADPQQIPACVAETMERYAIA